jgi:hypothetical protein
MGVVETTQLVTQQKVEVDQKHMVMGMLWGPDQTEKAKGILLV